MNHVGPPESVTQFCTSMFPSKEIDVGDPPQIARTPRHGGAMNAERRTWFWGSPAPTAFNEAALSVVATCVRAP
jgi:hypothetical protein